MEEIKKQELTKDEKWWFLRYLEEECEVVLSAWKELMKLKQYASENKLDEEEQRECSFRMWRCISEFLLAYANISKTIDPIQNLRKKFFKHELEFWEPGKSNVEKEELFEKLSEERKVRVKTLKKILSSILDGQEIDRSPRNYLEHFDAFLQLYIIENGTKVKTHRSFGCPNDKEPLERNLSFFHCSKNEIWFLGRKFPMEPIIEFIEKLKEVVNNELEKGEK
jgi:hypothetical protein